MGFLKNTEDVFYIENNQIKLTESYLKKNKNKFKKITGSRLASILNKNKYCSPVKIWAIMTGIYSEIMDTTLSTAGNVIEPKIKEYVQKINNEKYISYEPIKVGFDIFKTNPIFGGIPDGELVDDENNIFSEKKAKILEIKTTSIDTFDFIFEKGSLVLKKDNQNLPIVKSYGTKIDKWFDENGEILIPIEYQFQLGLYCYLRKCTKGIFAVGFLKYQDYINPYNFEPNDKNIYIVDFEIDLNEFETVMQYCTDWYNNFILKGTSPYLTEQDLNWLKENLKNE